MTVSTTDQVLIRYLGEQPYRSTLDAMKIFTHKRTSETPDELWVLQHPPVFTLGQAGKTEHLLTPGDIPVEKVDRGGQVTYHGPGQLVVYLLVNIKRRRMGVRHLVSLIENCLIACLADFGVTAEARADAPGVYVNDAKIAALGLRIHKGCAYHGLSFNLAMDLEPFLRINPCGYSNLPVTQFSQLVPDLFPGGEEQVTEQLLTHLVAKLGYNAATRITAD